MFDKLSFSGVARAGFILGCGLLGSVTLQSRADEGAHAPSQKDFAIKLARELGHDVGGDGASAIKLLSDLSIIPGVGPDAKWQMEAPATTKFVAEIQASLQLLLKRTAQDLAIAPPPTLDLFIFELPPAPQKVFFPAEEARQTVPQASAADEAGTGQEPPVAAPEAIGAPTFSPPPMVAPPTRSPAGGAEAAATPHGFPKPPMPGRPSK